MIAEKSQFDEVYLVYRIDAYSTTLFLSMAVFLSGDREWIVEAHGFSLFDFARSKSFVDLLSGVITIDCRYFILWSECSS